MINFAPTDDQPALEAALAKLAAGGFDWLTVTSATTVDVLSSHGAVIPETTRVAAVGETTAAALVAAGYRVDIVPPRTTRRAACSRSGRRPPTGSVRPARAHPALEHRQAGALEGLAAGGPPRRGRRRLPHGRRAGRRARSPTDVRSGRVNAVLVTSGSVAEQVQQQLGPIPEATLVAAIGPQTKTDAAQVGLHVDVVARERSAESLIDAVVRRRDAARLTRADAARPTQAARPGAQPARRRLVG